MSEKRIYLDQAATSYPKAPNVVSAITHCLTELGSAPGRATTRHGQEVNRVIQRCRQRIARLLGLQAPQNVIFTANGSDSLNRAIHGLVQPGDRVITSVWEHNSVLRPLAHLQQTVGIDLEIIGSDENGQIDLHACAQACEKPAKLVVLTHASNVTGIVQPVAKVSELAHQADAVFLLDAAQTMGTIPVTFAETGADLIAFPGHKGLRGPLGTGVLAIRPGIEERLQTTSQGGTGTSSESLEQPQQLPEKYEVGNLNAPAIFGLEAALAGINESTMQAHFQHETLLMEELISGLKMLAEVTLFYTDSQSPRVPVLSAHFERAEPQIMSSLLDEHYRIETRAGLHCAPLAHQKLGTLSQGGTVRFSVGPDNTSTEIDQALIALAEICAAF